MLRTLIVSSCTGEKKYKVKNPLTQEDFYDVNRLRKQERTINCFSEAAEMYTGLQHLRLMEGINLLRNHLGEAVVDLQILSTGYGLIAEDKLIAPYEVTFNTMSSSAIIEWSNHLQIPQALGRTVRNFDLVLFLLGEKYLRALQLPLEGISGNQKMVFLAGKSGSKFIPNEAPYFHIQIGPKDASAFSYGLVGLKGYLLKLLSQEAVKTNNTAMGVIDQIYHDPPSFLTAITCYRKNHTSANRSSKLQAKVKIPPTSEVTIMTNNAPDIFISNSNYAKNYGHPMRYFIPEWDDRIDPDYDFLTDTHVKDRDTYTHDVYAHEIYDKPCYDGILVSKVKIEESKKKQTKVEQTGIHQFLRFPSNLPVIGDCGAFGYIDQYEPPYTTEEILDYYDSLNFNIGVSIDHLIVGKIEKDPDERKRRYGITQDNAAVFLAKHKEGQYSFLPSGVAQGWDTDSYCNAFNNLIEMGYKHISLGGLVRAQTTKIIEILQTIKPLVPDYLQLHLFGVARIKAVKEFRELGVTSFDSASPLRRAWLGAGSNYFTLDGDKYTGIRVPPVSGHNVRVRKMINEGRGSLELFQELEQQALAALRAYDLEETGLAETLRAVLKYDELVGDKREGHEEMYRRVLEDKPWKQCPCKICRQVGIEVIIFRGNNRNRRRGFHNTYVFYKQFKDLCPGKVFI